MEIDENYKIFDLDRKILLTLKRNPDGLSRQDICKNIPEVSENTICKYMKKFMVQNVILIRLVPNAENKGRHHKIFYLDRNHRNLRLWNL
jgi:hypothetical protein